jgi:hypothetical protein
MLAVAGEVVKVALLELVVLVAVVRELHPM